MKSPNQLKYKEFCPSSYCSSGDLILDMVLPSPPPPTSTPTPHPHPTPPTPTPPHPHPQDSQDYWVVKPWHFQHMLFSHGILAASKLCFAFQFYCKL